MNSKHSKIYKKAYIAYRKNQTRSLHGVQMSFKGFLEHR